MPVMDEFREEREALKNESFKKKVEYFFYYYKWHVIGTLVTVIFLGTLAHDVLTAKDYALYGAFLNTYALEEPMEEMTTELATLLEVDTDEYIVDIDTTLSIGGSSSLDATGYTASEVSYTSQQKLMAYMAAAELDFIAADQTTFLDYASSETFYDLRQILTPAQIEKYEPYFFYVDMAEVRKDEEEANNGNFDYVMREFDPADPSTCVDPVPIAIYINNSEKISEIFTFREELVPMGIVANTKHLEDTLFFLDYLFE